VLGGVGTLRLPPSELGYRRCSITTSGNVSAGIPVLISPDAWNRKVFSEGAVLSLPPLQWQPMPQEWAIRFPSIAGVPRGVLRIERPAGAQRVAPGGFTEIHPFALMEYHVGNAQLYTFVFATALTVDGAYRHDLERFFARYQRAEGRDGRYLTTADVTEPLWDAEYLSPYELARSDPLAGSQLRLLERRIRDAHFGGRTLDLLLEALGALPDDGHLARLSSRIGIPAALWRGGGSLAAASARFVDNVPPEKLPELIDALALDYPELVLHPALP
jgi:hypothetical protein